MALCVFSLIVLVQTRFSSKRWSILVAVLSVALLSLTPLSTAYSGMGWAGVAESDYVMGTSVKYSPNGDIMASGHKNTVLITDTNTQAVLQQFVVDFTVETIEFSSDASYLILGMESELPNTPGAVVFQLNQGEYERAKHTEDGKYVDAISVTTDDAMFATATEDGGIAEWYIDTGSGSSLDMGHLYPATHDGHITCIDHSLDGQHMLSGGEDGNIIIWDRSNQTEIARWENSHPIDDCAFSGDGNTMAWIGGESLFLRNHDSTFSYSGQFDISESATQVEFTMGDQGVAILVDKVTDTPRRVDFINTSSMPIEIYGTLYLPHKATMLSLHPTENKLAVSTDSKFVAIYAEDVPFESELPTSMDTDQDNIPDTVDNDDDGDGILDVYDNVCASGNNCHLKPDQEYMRNINVDFGGNTVTIYDTIHLDAYQSSHIRKLVADSVSEPARVDQSEYDAFLFSMCDEYSSEEIKARWSYHLHIENSTFVPSSVSCRIDSGLYGTMYADSGTRISITWVITGTTTSALLAPYNITMLSGLELPSSSIAQMVHTFPIRLGVSDSGGMTFVEEVWDRRDADIEIQIIIPPEPEPTEIESVVDLLIQYWYAVLVAIICLGGLAYTALVRHSNRIDFSDLEPEEDEYDDEWEEMVDDAAAWEEDMDIPVPKKRKPKPPEAVTKDLKRKPRPPDAVQRDLDRRGEATVPARKVRKTTRKEAASVSKESIEFSHLINDEDHDSKETQDDDEEMMEDALSFITSDTEDKAKKRRPARRKKSEN